MQKNFDTWNEKKKHLDSSPVGPFCTEGEIWWAYVGLNIGSEENGKGKLYERPVLVIKRLGLTICIVAPLTTSRKNHPLRFALGLIHGRMNFVILSQIRTVDTRRFTDILTVLTAEKLAATKTAVRNLF